MKFFLNLSLLLALHSISNVQGVEGSICIRQADFATGTKIIKEPGVYKLCENIVFNPNAPAEGQTPSDNTFDPIFDGSYDENGFGLGFFAAIAISASNVELHLDGFTIEQSAGHALFQRFFSVIELADSPFIKSVGPAQFVADGDVFEPASNVKIIGPGTIGRSSHHGIHGNENSNVIISNVEFKDFEVAAVSLNNVDSLLIEDCNIPNNFHNVPVVGMFSAARFIRPYGKALKDAGYSMMLNGQETSAESVYDALIASINNVYNDVVNGPDGRINQDIHETEFDLFNNPFGVVDGPCYAFVVHGKGPAVGGHGDVFSTNENNTSSDVTIKGNNIQDIKCWTNEVPADVVDGTVVNDARGAVFQFVNSIDNRGIAMNDDGTYKGNVVADMQIMVAKAIQDGDLQDTALAQTGVNTIPSSIIDWAMAGDVSYTPNFRCNGDSMHHVSKGVVAIRVEDSAGFDISNNIIDGVVNFSPPPFAFSVCSSFHAGASSENLGEQQGGNVRGISVAAVRGYDTNKLSSIKLNAVLDIVSENANVIIGIDIQGDSKDIEVKSNIVNLNSSVGENMFDKYVALRVRENVGTGSDGVDILPSNKFTQEQQILNDDRRRNLLRSGGKNLPPGHPTASYEIEWELGGCPFGRAKK